tara:strand:+ start:696 stop:1028 length:333 start_codon:yes stop_codon:yes gene_type:complete
MDKPEPRKAKLKLVSVWKSKNDINKATLVFSEITESKRSKQGILRTFKFNNSKFKDYLNKYHPKDSTIEGLSQAEIVEKLKKNLGKEFEVTLGKEAQNPKYQDILSFEKR